MSKNIVITGSGSGLGRALAKQFASEGYRVSLFGRTIEKLQQVANEIGELAFPVVCDVRSAESVEQSFKTVADRFGHIDVLINNAAFVTHSSLLEESAQSISDSFLTNTVGPVLCSKAAVPLMKPGSHIINVSSGAVDNSYPKMSVYAASKAGMERFSKAICEELEPLGIRVTAVRCGQMVEDVDNWFKDPAIAEMVENAIAHGMDPRKRPSSSFASVAKSFSRLVNFPADLAAEMITFKPGAKSKHIK